MINHGHFQRIHHRQDPPTSNANIGLQCRLNLSYTGRDP
jgi:hypothetical protein